MKRFLKPLLGILAMGAALQPASATDYYLCGQRSYSVSDSQTFGILRFDTTSGNSSMTQVKELLSDPTAGGVKTGDRYYAFSVTPGDYGDDYYMYVYDAADNYTLITRASASSYFMSEGQVPAYNPADGKIYVSYAGSYYGMQFGTLDLSDRWRSKIADLDTDVLVMAFDNTGNLYAVTTTGYLYGINPANGDMTYIGSTGVSPDECSQAACMSPDGRTLYWAAYSGGNGALYSVDVTTGRAAKIKDMPDGELFASLWIDGTVVLPGCPGPATALTVDFPGGALSGNVTFTLPTVRHDGAALTGNLDYEVFIDGIPVGTGSGAAGTQQSVACSATNGKHDIKVVCHNSDGEGDSAELKGVFIGKDTPGYATDIRLAVDASGNVTLTWEAPAEGVNGGYFNPSEVKYKVVRMADDAVVSTDAVSPFTDTFASERPAKLFYTVTPYITEEISGLPMPSNKVMVGEPLGIPYSEDFTSYDDAFTIEMRDDPSHSWEWQYDFGYYRIYNNDTVKDDWLITPYLALEAGYQYNVAFDTRSLAKENMRVCLGTAPESQAMTQVIADTFTVDTDYGWQTLNYTFTVPVSGNYHIGFHANSDDPTSNLALYLDNLHVTNQGLTSVASILADAQIAVNGRELTVTPSGLARIAVYTADGRTLVNTATAAPLSLHLTPGVYVVTVNDAPRKVIVK